MDVKCRRIANLRVKRNQLVEAKDIKVDKESIYIYIYIFF